ncbi:unnamed protein product [Acanthoscelides obtectus]|uniref:Uncharacterized protein n=1 Tax=Acanthoscelides obtectus TaxID=200917 RepID=A0A9P0PVG6_ACAOB|nr:unnamed protein product [Acanthoscelides obtectus]CAK1622005.1 hypothetical protein AOBTE_LOCUS1265 [Acanthoscelides obtectus]
MEKKGNRNVPGSRGPPTESKKDVAVPKHFPRGGRRREPNGGGGGAYGGLSGGPAQTPKTEPARKQPPQRGWDQRRSKQQRSSSNVAIQAIGQMDRSEAARLADQDYIADLVPITTGKKQSLNHLLNFSYSPSPWTLK